MHQIDTKRSDIILVSYPPGGFGNFVYHCVSCFSSDTVKINSQFQFSASGHSHQSCKYIQVFGLVELDYEAWITVKDVDINQRIVILSDHTFARPDPGYVDTRKVFPNATIVRLCVDEDSKYVIFQTMQAKAKNLDFKREFSDRLSQRLGRPATQSEQRQAWLVDFNFHENDHRPNQHNFANGIRAWHPVHEPGVINISVCDLIDDPVMCLSDLIHTLGMQVVNLQDLQALCAQWKQVNSEYFRAYSKWHEMEQALQNGTNIVLDDIQCAFDQAYLLFRLRQNYGHRISDEFEWFRDMDQMREMIHE